MSTEYLVEKNTINFMVDVKINRLINVHVHHVDGKCVGVKMVIVKTREGLRCCLA